MRRMRTGWWIAALFGIASAAAGAVGTAAAAPASATVSASDGSRLSPEAARMYAAVRNPRPGELGWQQIPWMVELQEGMRLAREEKRPLLLFVSGDDPLEKC